MISSICSTMVLDDFGDVASIRNVARVAVLDASAGSWCKLLIHSPSPRHVPGAPLNKIGRASGVILGFENQIYGTIAGRKGSRRQSNLDDHMAAPFESVSAIQ